MTIGIGVSTSLDVGRLGEAIKRPGIDTRSWVTLAHVVAFKLNDDEGPLVDVALTGSGTIDDKGQTDFTPRTCRLGAFYAGPGFGFYAPLEKDDLVLVAFPDGDPALGGVIVARLWSMSDPPPDTATGNNTDVCLHVKKDTNLRIQAFGSGNVVLGSEDGKVLLGDETGTKAVARKDDTVDGGTVTAQDSLLAPVMFIYTPSSGPTAGIPGAPSASLLLTGGKITSGSDKVESS